MLTATVIGSVWATRRVAGLPSGAFLEVEVEAGNGQSGQRLIAFDVLGSGVGERVLIAQGSVAAAWFAGKPPPVDALIIGSIDPPPTGPSSAGPSSAGSSRNRKEVSDGG
ncbi:MAG: EutN/CcmL family microcompartment protein [Streptosporangiaceae bacterium]